MDEKLVREPLYEKLKKRLLVTIETENLHMLPNERELMARFGVSRNTLRRAIFELTKENILRPVQGIGTIVYPVPEIVENSRILIVCDREMSVFQQEVFNLLLFHLNNSRLNTIVLMLDKENVDVDRFDTLLKTCDGVVIDQLCSYSPVILERIRKTGKKTEMLLPVYNDLTILGRGLKNENGTVKPFVLLLILFDFYDQTESLVDHLLFHASIFYARQETSAGDYERDQNQ